MSNFFTNAFRGFNTVFHYQGLWTAMRDVFFRTLRLLKIFSCNDVIYFVSGMFKDPVCVRLGTSDAVVFGDIFDLKEYGLCEKINASFIIDGGGNVGYSAIHFYHQFPSAQILVVEPDEENYKRCLQNLKSYQDRCHIVNAAIWSEKTNLKLKESTDNLSWGIRVELPKADEHSDVQTTTIPDLMEEYDFPRIDLLKLDVEWAELNIFKYNYEKWLPKTKNIVIELHDDECKQVFLDALKGFRYDLEIQGAVAFCQNLQKV